MVRNRWVAEATLRRVTTALEVLALRQQVAVLRRKRARRKLNFSDRLLWTTLRRVWSCWAGVLVIVKPETVVGWHRAGFRLYWRWRSRPRGRGPKTTAEIRILIRRIAEENAGWSTPKILHFNVARHPTTEWVVQQLRGAFPEAGPYRYVILDRDSKFDADVIGCLKATGLRPTRTGIPSPWQNRTTERWVGSCRRELLHHVIPLNERRLGGLHHRYSRRQAA